MKNGSSIEYVKECVHLGNSIVIYMYHWKFNHFSSGNNFYIARKKTVRRIWKINSCTHNVLTAKQMRTNRCFTRKTLY